MIIPLASCIIGLHIGTYHIDRNAGFKEFNPGVYADCGGITAGHYLNSEGGKSDYLGVTTHYGIDWTIGMITGYKRGTMPMILPSVKVTKSLRVIVLPPIPGAHVNTAGVHIAYEFN